MNDLTAALEVAVVEQDRKPMKILLVGPSDDDMRELFKRTISGKAPGAIKRQTRRREQRRGNK